jgi:hypothetical protein
LIIGLNLACSTAPGTKVATLSTTGGDGNPVTYTISGTAPILSDLMIDGTALIVGPAGISPAHCGTTGQVTVKATQR